MSLAPYRLVKNAVASASDPSALIILSSEEIGDWCQQVSAYDATIATACG